MKTAWVKRAAQVSINHATTESIYSREGKWQHLSTLRRGRKAVSPMIRLLSLHSLDNNSSSPTRIIKNKKLRDTQLQPLDTKPMH